MYIFCFFSVSFFVYSNNFTYSLHDDKMECFYICVHKIGNISEGTHFRSSIEISGLQSLSVVHSRWAKSVRRTHTHTDVGPGLRKKWKQNQPRHETTISVSVIQRMSSRVHNIVWFSLDKIMFVFLYDIATIITKWKKYYNIAARKYEINWKKNWEWEMWAHEWKLQ